MQATQIASTPKAPALSKARVAGGFSISGKYTRENFTNRQEGEKYVSFWFFTPACGGGEACNVKTSGEGEGRKESLKLKKGTYSGTVQIPHGGECGTKKLTETQTITFTVKGPASVFRTATRSPPCARRKAVRAFTAMAPLPEAGRFSSACSEGTEA